MESGKINFQFAIVGGNFVDFKYLDLSPWGIKGGFVENKNTEKYIRSMSMPDQEENNWEQIKDASQSSDGMGGSGKHLHWEYMNLLWPIDIQNPPSTEDYFEAIGAIKVIHPSELFIQNIVEVEYFEGKGINIAGWIIYNDYCLFKYENPEDHYFIYPKEYFKETNSFLAFYKENYNKRDYIRNAIGYYLNSFKVNTIEMSFICLCISLETIVPGNEQLSYRFKRNLAVLCSESYEKGKKIYSKANKLYLYRSKLVHSGMNRKDFEKFDLIFKYAQILASRMIIEMLLHDIPNIKELDEKLTQLGFGQGNTISKGYKEFKGNIITWHKVSEYEL